MNDIAKISNQLVDIKALVMSREKDMAKPVQDLSKIERMIKMNGRKRPLIKSKAELEKRIKSIKQDIEDLSKMIRQLESRRTDLLREQIDAGLEEEARQLTIEVPDNDPLVGCMLLSAMYENAQYQFITTRQFHERLIKKMYTRQDEDGKDKGWDIDSITNPEFNDGMINKLEDIRTKREYLNSLRLAIRHAFTKMLEALPEDSPFIPKLSRRTDEQMEQYLRDRKAIRNREAAIMRQDAATQEINTWRQTDLETQL